MILKWINISIKLLFKILINKSCFMLILIKINKEQVYNWIKNACRKPYYTYLAK